MSFNDFVGAWLPGSPLKSRPGSKGSYNEITLLREPNPNYDPTLEEAGKNVKLNEFNNQPLIRDKVTGQFQTLYDIQPNLKTSREDLMDFLKSDEDESPFTKFQSRKIPAWMARKMEGKLNAKELKTVLFEKMRARP